MMQCETTKIAADNEQGFIVINACDFDDKKHKVFSAVKVEKVKKGKRTK